jgi:hypothetical protein
MQIVAFHPSGTSGWGMKISDHFDSSHPFFNVKKKFPRARVIVGFGVPQGIYGYYPVLPDILVEPALWIRFYRKPDY